jgi:hypothetical protein
MEDTKLRGSVAALLTLIATASIQDPGEWDLDDEQPVTVHLTLREVRLARRLLRETEEVASKGERRDGNN